jgi:hypothetical protein
VAKLPCGHVRTLIDRMKTREEIAHRIGAPNESGKSELEGETK